MPGNYMAHASALGVLWGLEAVAGTEETLAPLSDQFPNTIRDVDFTYQDRLLNYAEGPGSRYLQGQELIQRSYPFSLEFELYDPATMDALVFSDALDDVPSYTFNFGQGPTLASPTLASSLYGAKVDRWTLRLREGEPATIASDWIAMHAAVPTPFSYTPPTGRTPFMLAGATWSLGGDIVELEIEELHNLEARYPMQSTLPASGIEFDPKYLEPKMVEVTANFVTLSDYELDDPIDDSTDAVLLLKSPPYSPTSQLEVTLTNGTADGQRVRIPQRDFIEYRLRMRFQGLSYTYV